MDKYVVNQLLGVISCARKVLADMEPDDVPAALRRIERSSARKLPPPFARSLIEEMMSNESFRVAVAGRYADAETVDDVGSAFLADPVEAMADLDVRSEAASDVRCSTALESARERIVHLEEQLAEAKRRSARERDQSDEAVESARRAATTGQRRAEARLRDASLDIEANKAEIREAVERLRFAEDELVAVRARYTSAMERLRRRSGSQGPAPSARSDETPSDPLELARWLDRVERRVRPFRDPVPAHELSSTGQPLRVPSGLSPDSGGAFESLVSQVPHRFILDGYNISGEIDASSFSTREARDRVVNRAARLARSTEAEVLVVFDGPDDEERSGFRSSDGVVVRFSRGNKADDVIAELVRTDPDRTVVVTNDRDLRARCEVDGCVSVWSTAFLSW